MPTDASLKEDLATVATAYGELSFKNQELQKKNTILEERNDDLTKGVASLEESESRLQSSIQDIKDEESARSDDRAKELDVREETISDDRTVLNQDIDAHKAKANSLKEEGKTLLVRKDTVDRQEDDLHLREVDLKNLSSEVDDGKTARRIENKSMKERGETLNKREAEVGGREKAVAKDKENIVTQKKSIESVREGNKLEVAKLTEHHKKIRTDILKNANLKANIDQRIPKLKRLIEAGREIKEFAVAHDGKDDTIAHKISLVMDRLLSDSE